MHLNISLPRSNENDLQEFILTAFAVEIFMILFFHQRKVYDLSTAAFFALSLGLLARQKFLAYYILFPVACLNRETAFLLTLFYALHFVQWSRLGWLLGTLYQGAVYLVIRVSLMLLYAHNPGTMFLFRPIENLKMFMAHPWANWIHWSFFVVVAWVCIRNWKEKPPLLRNAFIVLAPSLLVLYLFLGWSFEIRVFAELYPVAFALAVNLRV